MDRIGRYKIVRELGRGAMGVVYHAIDPNIGRPVAIKTIELGGKPEDRERMRERLFREARSAGILSHPGIVTIYDVEQQGDVAYIAMEYVDGPTLDQIMTADQPVPPERIFSILAQTAAALDYAHQKGIVHRDIKPANIMIAADGSVKVTDFGIAKVTASEQFTMTGSIVGTPHYMSPEQVQGQAIDGRSDQFSLAVVAFELLTGDKPYTGEHLTTVVYKIVAEEPVAPHRLNPTLTGAIETVLQKGMAKKPDARFRTAQEFVESLEKACAATRGWKPLARGGGLSQDTLEDAAAPVINLPPARRARHGDTTVTSERPPKKKSGFLPFLGAVLVAAAVLALIGWQADPTLPGRVRGVAQRIGAAVGLPGGPSNSGEAPNPAVESAQTTPPPAEPTAQEDVKPSPMPPASTAPPGAPKSEGAQPPTAPAAGQGTAPAATPAQTQPGPVAPESAEPEEPPQAAPKTAPERRRPQPRPVAAPQPVLIVTSPAGATATMDGRAEAACATPCSIDAAPGRHTLILTLNGYQAESRDVVVGSNPVEVPPIVMRTPTGTLMLSSEPGGATISINGRRLQQTTPAQIALPPGSYRLTVEKDGKQATSMVEIRNQAISSVRIILQ